MQRMHMELCRYVSDKLVTYPAAIALLLFIPLLYAADGERDFADGTNRSVPGRVKLTLTPEEQAWLAEHPAIVFGGPRDLAPFSFIGKNGRYQGYNVDLIQIINELIGSDIQIVAGEWAGMNGAAP